MSEKERQCVSERGGGRKRRGDRWRGWKERGGGRDLKSHFYFRSAEFRL